MRQASISSQMATAIAKKEYGGKLPPLGEKWLLKTGAKLSRQVDDTTGKRVWFIMGYHWAGDDVTHYVGPEERTCPK